MSKRVIIAALLTALAVFAVLIAVFSRRQGPPGPPPQLPVPAAPTGAAPGDAGQPAPKVTAPAVTPPAAGQGAAAGAGHLLGRVLAAGDRAPVASALVRAGPSPGRLKASGPFWTREVTTDADGRFDIDQAQLLPWRLRVSSPGYLDQELEDAVPDSPVEILLVPDAGIPCRLEVETEDDPQPLPNQAVLLQDISELTWAYDAETDARGAFLLSGLGKEGFEALRSTGALHILVPGYADPELGPDAAGGGYVITVGRGKTIVGMVLDADSGGPIAGAVVHTDSGHEVAADARGAFEISGVTDTLSAYAPGYALEEQDTSDLDEDSAQRLDFRLRRGLTLKGRLLDGQGHTLPGATISVVGEDLDLDSESELLAGLLVEKLSTRTDEQGRFRLAGLPAEALDLPGDLGLEVTLPDSGAVWGADVELDAEAGEVERDVVIDVAGAIPGTVMGADGRPAARAVIFADSLDGDYFVSALSAADGRFQLGPLVPGQYAVRVEQSGAVVHLAELTAPAASLELRLDALESVEGTVRSEATREPIEGIRVSLHPLRTTTDPISPPAKTGADGRFALPRAPRGSYVLFVTLENSAPGFLPHERSTRLEVSLGPGGWKGDVLLPSRPSGLVDIKLEPPPQAVSLPGDTPVRVSIISALDENGRTTPITPGFSFNATLGGGFQSRWRAGKYVVRFRLQHDGQDYFKEDSFELPANGSVQRSVRLTR